MHSYLPKVLHPYLPIMEHSYLPVTAEQQQLIDHSLKEIESGEYFTDEAVQKESEEWLKK